MMIAFHDVNPLSSSLVVEVEVVREEGIVAYAYLCTDGGAGYRSPFRAWATKVFAGYDAGWEMFAGYDAGWEEMRNDPGAPEHLRPSEEIADVMMQCCKAALAAQVCLRGAL